MSGLWNLLIVAVVFGGVLYLFKLIPIDETIKKVFTVVAIIVFIVMVIKFLMGYF
jgi:ABC-type uncharacterized transport system permease subunit